MAISPFVFLGSILRVLVDSRIINYFPLMVLLTTPNIYILIGLSVVSLLYFSLYLEKKKIIDYHKLMFLLGLFAVTFSITFIRFINLYGAFLVLIFIIPWLLFSLFFKIWSLENRLALFFQMFDANVTFVTLNFFGIGNSPFGYVEQHVVPSLLINFFGPYSFIIVKAIVVAIVLILIDKLSKDKEFNNYIKLIIGILGAATGGRDLLRLVALV